MKLQDAIAGARRDAVAHNTMITVYRDPIGLGEQDGFDTPWGWCPTSALHIIAAHRESAHDIQVHRSGKLLNAPSWDLDSHWDDHPDFPPADWVAEVQDNNTRQSYLDWVRSQIIAACEA